MTRSSNFSETVNKAAATAHTILATAHGTTVNVVTRTQFVVGENSTGNRPLLYSV